MATTDWGATIGAKPAIDPLFHDYFRFDPE
jgi:hypothetical protein